MEGSQATTILTSENWPFCFRNESSAFASALAPCGLKPASSFWATRYEARSDYVQLQIRDELPMLTGTKWEAEKVYLGN